MPFPLSSSTRGILLDIEGTTSSISFVHDVMFPFVRTHLNEYLIANWNSPSMDQVRAAMAQDDGYASWPLWLEAHARAADNPLPADMAACQQRILELMDADAKITGLKLLQGQIWDLGFRSGQLQSHVYPDVLPAIEAWRSLGLDVRIYSSGSIAAQKLFFSHVADRGDCLHLFTGHYDTTFGNKREPESYLRIARDWQLKPEAIIFVSDLEAELKAATTAGCMAVASVRPGNAPLSPDAPWPQVGSFL